MAIEYRLAERTINTYFQKSYKFLYPLLSISNKNITPLQTFTSWKNKYKIQDCKLICVYELDGVLNLNTTKDDYIPKIDPVTYRQFERVSIFRNAYYETFFECEDNKGAYIFDMSKYREDWEHFHNGAYSQFSTKAKTEILRFYVTNSFSTEYMNSYLYPEKYFNAYSKLLNIDESLLVEIGQLCDPYNKDREIFKLETIETPCINSPTTL
jgi:hypothetical protein